MTNITNIYCVYTMDNEMLQNRIG